MRYRNFCMAGLAAALLGGMFFAVHGNPPEPERQSPILQRWDAAAEFSAEVNPNGVWSYRFGRDGLEIKEDGTQTGLFLMRPVESDQRLLPEAPMNGTRFGTAGIVGWKGVCYPGRDPLVQRHRGNNEYWCVVAKNTTDADITISQYPSFVEWVAPAGKLILNSCADYQGASIRTVVEFTAPEAGHYRYRARWEELSTQKRPEVSISCLIFEKGVRKLAQSMFDGNDWAPVESSGTVELAAGDTLWFCNQNNQRYVVDNPVSLECVVERIQ